MNENSLDGIGVFDSGIGGVTVLAALAKRFPTEKFIYLGDTARLPYGSKSAATIRKYTEQNLEFLTQKKVKAIVIACNSASAQYPDTSYKNIPVFNVIRPGIQAALKATKNNRVGVIGTRATIASSAYTLGLKQINPEIQVFHQACPLLVPLCEEGWIDDPVTNLIIYRYLQPLTLKDIDTLILGCTHYPILTSAIERVMTAKVSLVDSGLALADELELAFHAGRFKLPAPHNEGEIHIFCTDVAASFRNFTGDLLRQHNLNFDEFELADLQQVG